MSAPIPASLWLRVAAALYDVFPLAALWMLSASLFLLASGGHVDVAHPPFAYRIALRACLLAVSAAYFVVSWTRGGQTIGMRAWRLRVVAQDGGGLSWQRALLRFVVGLVSAVVLGLGFLWCLIDGQKRSWHDIASGSVLVRQPPH